MLATKSTPSRHNDYDGSRAANQKLLLKLFKVFFWLSFTSSSLTMFQIGSHSATVTCRKFSGFASSSTSQFVDSAHYICMMTETTQGAFRFFTFLLGIIMNINDIKKSIFRLWSGVLEDFGARRSSIIVAGGRTSFDWDEKLINISPSRAADCSTCVSNGGNRSAPTHSAQHIRSPFRINWYH